MSLLGGIDIQAQIEAGIGSRLDRLTGSVGQLRRDGYRRTVPLIGSLVGISGQTAATNIPGPEGGFEYHLRRLSIAPTLGGVQVSAQGTLIVAKGQGISLQSQGSGQAVNLTTLAQAVEVTRTSTIPNMITWGGAEFVLRYPEQLIILWASGTAGCTLLIDGDAQEVYSTSLMGAEA